MLAESEMTPAADHRIRPGNQESQGGVKDRAPGEADQPGAGNNCHIGKRIAEVVNKHGAQVQVAALAHEAPRDSSVYHQSDGPDHQHGARGHRLRPHDSLVAFVAEIKRNRHQQQRVDEGYQHACALIAIGLSIIGGTTLKIERDPRKYERRNVGKIVPSIAHQSQTVRQRPNNELHSHERQRPDQGDDDQPRDCLPMVMMLVM